MKVTTEGRQKEERKNPGETGKKYTHLTRFIPQMPTRAGAGPDQSKEPGTPSGFPQGWQEPNYLSHHSPPAR